MPRKFGSVNVEIWNDPEFRKLPPAAQHLYLLLWTAPALSFCGVHEWRPSRLTKLSQGFGEGHTRAVGASLVARHFLVIDDETEEVLVRSWARFDEVLKQPRLAVSYANAYAAVYSPVLRQVLAHETQKMREMWPGLPCWGDPRVNVILTHEAVSAKDLPVPEDPFGLGFAHEFGDGFALGLAQTSTNVWPRVSAPPTPAPTPAPNTLDGGDADATPKSKKASQLPTTWLPNAGHLDFAEVNLLSITEEADAFRDHHEARGTTFKDWDAAFRNWLRNAVKFRKDDSPTATRGNALRAVEDIEEAPSGMNDEEYREWHIRTYGGGK